jgi:DNA-binding NtrC family response regulator
MQPGEKTRAPLRSRESDQGHASAHLRLTVVFHPDLTRIGASMKLGTVDASGIMRLDASVIGRNAPLFSDDLALDEPHVSRRALTLSHHARGLLLADASGVSHCQLGPDKSASMAVTFDELKRGLSVRFGHGVVCWLRLSQYKRDVPARLTDAVHDFAGVSPEASAVRRLIDVAAQCDLPTLLCGETGVGKEIVARAIYARSHRSKAPLVSVNMAALPETLADAELFGVARGAYTGAETRAGYFQRADGGTLFLDEIGEAPLSLQPKLLRTLQEGEVPVVGGKTKRVDVRIIAASDAKLSDASQFKQPLLHRLAGIKIDIPPLSARREDLGVLLLASSARVPSSHGASHIKDLSLAAGISIDSSHRSVPLGLDLAKNTPSFAAAWAQFIYDALNTEWPGNVRAFLLAAQRYALNLADHESQFTHEASDFEDNEGDSDRRSERRRDRESAIRGASIDNARLKHEHAAANYEIAETARRLGMSRQAVYRRLQQIPELRLAGQLPDREFLVAIKRVGDDIDALSRHLKISRAAIAQRLKQMGARK